MDESAVKQLQQGSSVSAAADSVQAALGKNQGAVALPSEFKLTDLQHLMDGPLHFTGCMKTADIDEFVRYVHDNDGGECFVSAEEMCARAHFDLGDADAPGHNHYTAQLSLKKTAEFAALTKIDGERRSQRDMSEWFEDWGEFMTAEDGDGNSISNKRVVAALRRMTIESVKEDESNVEEYRQSRSSMESIEAKSKAEPLPRTLSFACVPYHGLSPTVFSLRLSVTTGRGAPEFVLRIRQMEVHAQSMSRELCELLKKRIESVYVGTFNK